MIHVVAEITTKPGCRDKVLELFRAAAEKVRQEPGCIEYGGAVEVESGLPVQPSVRPNVITVIEKWESLEALNAHAAADALHQFLEQAGPMMEGLTARVMEPA